MTQRPPSAPIPPRSSHNPDRRTLHLNLTAREYATIAERSAIAGLSRPCYVREAALAFQIYQTTSPTEILAHATSAIACIRSLASSPAVGLHFATWRRFEAAIAELHGKTTDLERHLEHIAAILALRPPDSPNPLVSARRLPGPGSSIWRLAGPDAPSLLTLLLC
jgi:hypothetical protein